MSRSLTWPTVPQRCGSPSLARFRSSRPLPGQPAAGARNRPACVRPADPAPNDYFRAPAGAGRAIPLATSRCRDVRGLRAGDARDSDRRARSLARSLRPSERPLTARLVRHGFSRAGSPARTTTLGGKRSPQPAGVARRTCVCREREGGAPLRRVYSPTRSGTRTPVGVSALTSGRAAGGRLGDEGGVLFPESGIEALVRQWVGDGCADSRGGPALPTSPSAGLRPIRRRPSRPSPDRASMLGRPRGSLDHETATSERPPPVLPSAASCDNGYQVRGGQSVYR